MPRLTAPHFDTRTRAPRTAILDHMGRNITRRDLLGNTAAFGHHVLGQPWALRQLAQKGYASAAARLGALAQARQHIHSQAVREHLSFVSFQAARESFFTDPFARGFNRARAAHTLFSLSQSELASFTADALAMRVMDDVPLHPDDRENLKRQIQNYRDRAADIAWLNGQITTPAKQTVMAGRILGAILDHDKTPLTRLSDISPSNREPFVFDDPEQVRIELYTGKKTDTHTVILLSNKDYYRFTAHNRLPWDDIDPKTQRTILNSTSNNFGTNIQSLLSGTISIVRASRSKSAQFYRMILDHEERHHINSSFGYIEDKKRHFERMLRAVQAFDTPLAIECIFDYQLQVAQDEISAFMTDPSEVRNPLNLADRLSSLFCYASGFETLAVLFEHDCFKAFLNANAEAIVQAHNAYQDAVKWALCAAGIIMQHPLAEELLSNYEIHEWPELALRLCEMGMLPFVSEDFFEYQMMDDKGKNAFAEKLLREESQFKGKLRNSKITLMAIELDSHWDELQAAFKFSLFPHGRNQELFVPTRIEERETLDSNP